MFILLYSQKSMTYFWRHGRCFPCNDAMPHTTPDADVIPINGRAKNRVICQLDG